MYQRYFGTHEKSVSQMCTQKLDKLLMASTSMSGSRGYVCIGIISSELPLMPIQTASQHL